MLKNTTVRELPDGERTNSAGGFILPGRRTAQYQLPAHAGPELSNIAGIAGRLPPLVKQSRVR